MFWKRWFQKTEPRKSQFAVIADRYRALDPGKMGNVFSSDMSIRRISVCRDNIEEFIQLLKTVIDHIRNEKMMYPAMLPHSVKQVYIRDFYTNKRDHYVDPVKTTQELRNYCAELLNLFEEKETCSDKSFILEKNLLLIQTLINNILNLIEDL